MINEIQALMEEYVTWLKAKNSLRQIDNWIEITTPYLDRHNDYLQIYVTKLDNGYLLTDDGYIINDLKQSGCSLDSSKRESLLHTTLNGFGVRLSKEQAIEVRATADNFALRKHNLLQAMLAVNDLFYLATPTVASIFKEDVIAWLDKIEARYISDIKFTGKSGYDHRFDFAIPKSHNQPERILQTINRPNRDTAEALAFAWYDTKVIRNSDTRAYAIINDSDRDVPTGVIDALQNYDIKTVLWRERGDAKAELVA